MLRTDDVWTGAPLDQIMLAAKRGSKGARRELFKRGRADGLDLAVSPGGRPIDTSSLDRSPKKNWVEKRGGLPPYVRGVARGIARSRGHATPTDRDVAAAIAAMKRWARGGDDVQPAVRAAAAKALAHWTAIKGGTDLSLTEEQHIDLAVWRESLHPRDHRGRFARKGTGALLRKAIEFGRAADPEDFDIHGGAYASGTGGNLSANDKSGKYAGHISWNHTGEISSIDVRSDLRRKGVGTMLALLAREQDPAVHHSEVLTTAGKRFEEGTRDILGLMPEALRPEMRRKTPTIGDQIRMLQVPDVSKDTISPAEKARIRKRLEANPVDSKHIVDLFEQATPGEVEAGEVWYPNAHRVAQVMAKRHGIDVRTAAGLLANYSPQKPWGRNMIEAHQVAMTKKPHGGTGANIVVDLDALDEVNERRVGVMTTSTQKRRAVKLLAAGKDFNEVFAGRNKTGSIPPKSLKIRAFGELIANGGQPDGADLPLVVIDRHAAGVARGIRFTEDDFTIDGPSGSLKKYRVYADAYRAAAETLSEKHGRRITPEQVQAVTWLTRQRLNGETDSRRKSLGARDAKEALHYFAQYEPDIAEIIVGGMTGYMELSNEEEQ